MRIACVGGGPSGLYLAILMKKADPSHEIVVLERNRADDTFGFGVVFSDATLGTFLDYDPPSYESIRRSFAYWDDVEVVYKGQALRCAGNGFCGCSRVTLLKLLQQRCRELGVAMRFQSEASAADFKDSDLVVAADGINSKTRETYREHFKPSVDLRPNKFTWLGSTKPLDVAQLPEHPQRDLGEGQRGADRRRQGHRALLDRLGHQARDGGRDRLV